MKIVIEASTYGKQGTRLTVWELDENGNGGGHRITGPKYNDYRSSTAISVPLTLEEQKDLVSELQRLIAQEEANE